MINDKHNLAFRAAKQIKKNGLIGLCYFSLESSEKILRDNLYKMKKSLKRHKFVVKKIQKNRMYLNLKDEGISKDLLMYGIREQESTKEIKKILNKDDVVLDIGANIGYYVLNEARLIGNSGKVYACEPVPENFKLLEKNIKLNGFTNVETYNIALGNKNKETEMYISEKSNLHSMIRTRNVSDKKIKIQLLTVDEFLKNKKTPNLIRMDVEGYEYKILEGMKETLKNKKFSKLFIEIHFHIMDKSESEALLEILKKDNFEIKKISICYGTNIQMIFGKIKKQWPYSAYRIKDILLEDRILEGKEGAFEIFFERKIET